MALGATRTSVVRLVVGQGIALAVVGGAIGLAGALATTRVLRSLLYGVAPSDPVTFAAIVALLVTRCSWRAGCRRGGRRVCIRRRRCGDRSRVAGGG